MNALKLLELWLKDNASTLRKKEVDARAAFGLLKDNTTPYAIAMEVLADAHGHAAAQYEAVLEALGWIDTLAGTSEGGQ